MKTKTCQNSTQYNEGDSQMNQFTHSNFNLVLLLGMLIIGLSFAAVH
jgi:hypothetical protein